MPIDQSTLDQALGTNFDASLADNRARLAAAQAKRDTIDPALASAQSDVAKLETKTAEEAQPIRSELANFAPRTSTMTPPQAPEAPKPQVKPEDIQKTAGMMMVVAGLLGVVGRGSWTGALNSMTGALKGYQEGNLEQAKTQLDQYKVKVEEFKTKLEAFRADRDDLDRMDQRDVNSLRNRLELVAHAHDAELVAAKARVASYTDARKELDTQISKMQAAVDHSQTTEESMRRMLMEKSIEHQNRLGEQAAAGGAGAEHSEAARALYGELITAGKSPPKGRRGEVDWAQLESMAAHEEGGAGSGSVIAGQADYKANAKSLSTQQSRVDAIDASMKKIGKDIKTIDTTIGKGNAGFVKFINEPLNSLRTQTSDPDLAAYALSVKQVATEYERAIQGGLLSSAQLHQGAADDAKKILNESMSVGEVRSVIPVMLREMDNARHAASEQLHEIRDRMHKAPATSDDDLINKYLKH